MILKLIFNISTMPEVDNIDLTNIEINSQEDEEEMICDIQFQNNILKQSHSIINTNYLTIIFLILLVLICQQIISISYHLPNYQQEYTTFIKEELIENRSHKHNKLHFNPFEQKIETFLEKIQSLQHQLISINTKHPIQNKKIDKALKNINNIKKIIKKIISKISIEEKIQKNEQILRRKYTLNIPKHIWAYKQAQQSYIETLSQQNYKYFARMSHYKINFINQSNYINYFSAETNLELNIAFSHIESINDRIPNAKKLKKLLILYNLLYEYGGVMIDGPFAFSEDLKWISNISNSIIKLQGNRGITPQMIAFYKPQNSRKSYFNIEPFEGIQQVDKYISQIPAIQSFFMASIKKSQFLHLFINKIYQIINNVEFIQREKALYHLEYDKKLQFSKMVIYSASQMILKEKQKEIDSLNVNSYKRFAFDYYGIAFINAYFGPYKLDMLYKDFWPAIVPQISRHSSYFDLARYKYEDFLEYSGPIKYLCQLNNIENMQIYLNNSAHGDDIQIYRGSLIQRLFYPESNQPFIVANPQQSFTDLKNDIWTRLPKIIWIYWANGIINSSPFHQMCFHGIKKTANKTGFQVIQINNDNLNKYIPQKELDKIRNNFLNAKSLIRIQSISDVYRLEVLYRHGGIYFDITSVGIDNYNWILDIGRLPSQFIFNRFGKTPKVLMSSHPFDGQPGAWSNQQIDTNRSIKAQWHLGLQNSWIAAQKQSQFIKQWKDLFLQFIVSPYEDIEAILVMSGVNQTRWTLPDNHYLLAMDAAKAVLGRRQKMLQNEVNNSVSWKNSADYYKIWTFNTYLGPTKLRSNLNYDDPGQKVNAYLFRYPLDYVKQIIGEPRFYIKFFGYEVEQIIKFIISHPFGNLTNNIHSQSFFKKYLWDDKFLPLIANENKLLNKIK